MNYNSSPPDRPTKSFDELLQATLQVYSSAPGPFIATAALGLIPSNLIGLAWQPPGILLSSLQLLISLVPLFIAQAALTVLTWETMEKKANSIASNYLVALSIAPRYVALQTIISVVTAAAVVTVVGIPVALILSARWALAAPAIIFEQLDVMQALKRSWQLVEGRAIKTLGIVIAFILVLLLVSLISLGIASLLGGGVGANIVVVSVIQAIVLPVAMIFFVLLYYDYNGSDAYSLNRD